MSRKRTMFSQLKVGARFVLPGDTEVLVKLDAQHAKNPHGVSFAVNPYRAVVPELNATVEDILGSWSNL